MIKLSELAKRDFERLKRTYIFFEEDGRVVDLYPIIEKDLTGKNVTMIFVPKSLGESVILEPEDLIWADPRGRDFDFFINPSSGLKTNRLFTHLEVGEELSTLLDIEIGQRKLAKEFSLQELKKIYFYANGSIYPATDENDEPTTESIKIYNMVSEDFEKPELVARAYFLGDGDNFIEDAPTEVWPILKELAHKDD